MLLRFLLTIALFFPICLYAQDTLYMKDGRIFDCEIRNEDTSFIYLKRFEQRSGDLTLAKKLVSKIKYKNGSIISVQLPHSDAYEPSSVVVSISPIINFRGMGVGISCEVPLVKNKLTFFLPVYITGIGYGGESVNITQIMPAIKYYPGKKMASKQRYAIGLQFLFQNGSYQWHSTSSGGLSYMEDNDAFNLGIMVNNSINFFPGRHLYIGFDLAPGFSIINNGEFPLLLHYNMRIGYRK